ncbi:hypothetical protein, partial [Duncaniella muris]
CKPVSWRTPAVRGPSEIRHVDIRHPWPVRNPSCGHPPPVARPEGVMADTRCPAGLASGGRRFTRSP